MIFIKNKTFKSKNEFENVVECDQYLINQVELNKYTQLYLFSINGIIYVSDGRGKNRLNEKTLKKYDNLIQKAIQESIIKNIVRFNYKVEETHKEMERLSIGSIKELQAEIINKNVNIDVIEGKDYICDWKSENVEILEKLKYALDNDELSASDILLHLFKGYNNSIRIKDLDPNEISSLEIEDSSIDVCVKNCNGKGVFISNSVLDAVSVHDSDIRIAESYNSYIGVNRTRTINILYNYNIQEDSLLGLIHFLKEYVKIEDKDSSNAYIYFYSIRRAISKDIKGEYTSINDIVNDIKKYKNTDAYKMFPDEQWQEFMEIFEPIKDDFKYK